RGTAGPEVTLALAILIAWAVASVPVSLLVAAMMGLRAEGVGTEESGAPPTPIARSRSTSGSA
ncbi:MAG TPA: hypothetical protein VNY84_15085, partial [Acidimicrobiales bacterium]|nr:hypothetical protein [Acidimicrobiales bacterium]